MRQVSSTSLLTCVAGVLLFSATKANAAGHVEAQIDLPSNNTGTSVAQIEEITPWVVVSDHHQRPIEATHISGKNVENRRAGLMRGASPEDVSSKALVSVSTEKDAQAPYAGQLDKVYSQRRKKEAGPENDDMQLAANFLLSLSLSSDDVVHSILLEGLRDSVHTGQNEGLTSSATEQASPPVNEARDIGYQAASYFSLQENADLPTIALSVEDQEPTMEQGLVLVVDGSYPSSPSSQPYECSNGDMFDSLPECSRCVSYLMGERNRAAQQGGLAEQTFTQPSAKAQVDDPKSQEEEIDVAPTTAVVDNNDDEEAAVTRRPVRRSRRKPSAAAQSPRENLAGSREKKKKRLREAAAAKQEGQAGRWKERNNIPIVADGEEAAVSKPYGRRGVTFASQCMCKEYTKNKYSRLWLQQGRFTTYWKGLSSSWKASCDDIRAA